MSGVEPSPTSFGHSALARAQHRLRERHQERQLLGHAPRQRQEADQERAGERQKHERGGHSVALERKYTPSTAAPATSTVAYWRTTPVWAPAVARASMRTR